MQNIVFQNINQSQSNNNKVNKTVYIKEKNNKKNIFNKENNKNNKKGIINKFKNENFINLENHQHQGNNTIYGFNNIPFNNFIEKNIDDGETRTTLLKNNVINNNNNLNKLLSINSNQEIHNSLIPNNIDTIHNKNNPIFNRTHTNGIFS